MDDLTIPIETKIFYSRANSILTLIMMAFFLICGLGLIICANYLFGVILTILGACATFLAYNKLNNNKPQLVINASGMATSSTEFKNWSEINNESIISKSMSVKGGSINYLIYDFPGGSEEFIIDDLKTSSSELEYLMKIYRGRSKKKDDHV